MDKAGKGIIILKGMMIMIFAVNFNNNALAIYQEKSARTNINKVNPLFKENIENYQQMQIDTDKLVKSAKKQAASDDIRKLPQSKDAASESDKLSKIGVMQARSLGRQKQLQEKDEDNIFVDYDSSIFKGHKRDADKIISAASKLLENLLSKLKDIGVDCKETEGNKLSEPEYHLQIKKEKIKNTHYNKAICEYPRNKYICHDFLKAKCIKKGKKWGKWQNRSITFSLLDTQNCMWHTQYSGVDAMHYRFKNDSFSLDFMKKKIMARMGIKSSDQIYLPNQQIVINRYVTGRSVNCSFCVWNFRSHSTYLIFHYQYRDGTDICTNWQFMWEQECKLQ